MVGLIRQLAWLAGLAALLTLAGCPPSRVPQYVEDPSKHKMTPEEAQKAKAKEAAKFSKGYEEARKRFGATGTGGGPPAPPGK